MSKIHLKQSNDYSLKKGKKVNEINKKSKSIAPLFAKN